MDATARATLSLSGLSVGDAFGGKVLQNPLAIRSRELPEGPWRWSDDTHMALSVVEALRVHGSIDQDALARAFAARFEQEPCRGYGQGARRLLEGLAKKRPWQALSHKLFQGGSYGNGAAMRVGPLGAWFAGQPGEAAQQATRQAEVTHAHPEGKAGAVAVAVAASLICGPRPVAGVELLDAVLALTPRGETHDGVRAAMKIPRGEVAQAARTLGTGRQISAQDTVPFCLWCAAHHLGDFEEAMWTTISGEEDGDTTCAIVGSLVALRSAPPSAWLAAREPLPPGF